MSDPFSAESSKEFAINSVTKAIDQAMLKKAKRLQEEINILKEAHKNEIINLKAKFAIEKQKEID